MRHLAASKRLEAASTLPSNLRLALTTSQPRGLAASYAHGTYHGIVEGSELNVLADVSCAVGVGDWGGFVDGVDDWGFGVSLSRGPLRFGCGSCASELFHQVRYFLFFNMDGQDDQDV